MGNAARYDSRASYHNMVVGNSREICVDCKGSASYATGGDTINVKEISGGAIIEADFVEISPLTNDGVYRLSIVYPNRGRVKTVKVVAEVFTTDAEVANAVDWSSKGFKVRLRGN